MFLYPIKIIMGLSCKHKKVSKNLMAVPQAVNRITFAQDSVFPYVVLAL